MDELKPDVASAMNGALCAFAMRWELDGDYIRCRQCTSPQLTTYSDREFLHHPGCKAAGAVETHPWRTYLELLAPLIAAWNTRPSEDAGAVDEWRPIETAPEDGTPIFLATIEDGVVYDVLNGHFECLSEDEDDGPWDIRDGEPWCSYVGREAGIYFCHWLPGKEWESRWKFGPTLDTPTGCRNRPPSPRRWGSRMDKLSERLEAHAKNAASRAHWAYVCSEDYEGFWKAFAADLDAAAKLARRVEEAPACEMFTTRLEQSQYYGELYDENITQEQVCALHELHDQRVRLVREE